MTLDLQCRPMPGWQLALPGAGALVRSYLTDRRAFRRATFGLQHHLCTERGHRVSAARILVSQQTLADRPSGRWMLRSMGKKLSLLWATGAFAHTRFPLRTFCAVHERPNLQDEAGQPRPRRFQPFTSPVRQLLSKFVVLALLSYSVPKICVLWGSVSCAASLDKLQISVSDSRWHAHHSASDR